MGFEIALVPALLRNVRGESANFTNQSALQRITVVHQVVSSTRAGSLSLVFSQNHPTHEKFLRS